MNDQLRQHLESHGYTVCSVAEFLDLTPEEEALVDTGLVLSDLLKEARLARGLSQAQLEKKAGLKAGDLTELEVAMGTRFQEVFHILYSLGVPPREIAARLAQVELKGREAVA